MVCYSVRLGLSQRSAMGEQLESILLECNVDPATVAGIVAAGWTPETLAICASSPDDLETHLEESNRCYPEFPAESLLETGVAQMSITSSAEGTSSVE